MGFFSSFFRPQPFVRGSYCDSSSRSDVDYIEGDDIDEAIASAHERRDGIIYGDDEWSESTENQRFDDDMQQIKQGPGLW
jgi:hypothetical protein